MITVRQRGSFKHTEGFFKKAKEKRFLSLMKSYGEKGVKALAEATPKDTGLTAASWSYRVVSETGRARLIFDNSNVKEGYAYGQEGVSVAILLQYGHASRNGSWVEGIDYINPALKPIFDDIADKIWAEVKAL